MSTSFNSEDLGLFASVLERACTEMQGCDEPTRSLIAWRILHLARDGERDPERLLDYAKHINDPIAA